MATLVHRPEIEFTNALVQDRVKVTFKVAFKAGDMDSHPPPSVRKMFPDMPTSVQKITYSASIDLNVIRVGPTAVVAGGGLPPLPDPVRLQTTTVSVPKPTTGFTTSKNVSFTYRIGSKKNLIFDHLHARVVLFRTVTALGLVYTLPVESQTTGDLVMTVANLARRQAGGVVIPSGE